MKILMYLLTVIFGAIGALGVLRFLERALLGAEGSGSPVGQALVGLVFLVVASKCFNRARTRTVASG